MSAPNGIQGALTVDLEEWFQGLTSTNPRVDLWPGLASRVVPSTQALLELLAGHRVHSTFFVLGAVASDTELVARWRRRHEIAVPATTTGS